MEGVAERSLCQGGGRRVWGVKNTATLPKTHLRTFGLAPGPKVAPKIDVSEIAFFSVSNYISIENGSSILK